MHPVLKKSLLTTTMLLCALTGRANPPAWWGDGATPVIIPGAASNNYGPANIGQAKHMAKSALAALASVLPEVATDIETDLVGPDKPIPNWNPPADQAERDKNHVPLLTGQLKAIAHPFYVHLNAAAPTWLAEQRAANGTESGGIFPWTDAASDDNHHGMANIGQLKAVFALHFTHDTDGDSLPDLLEHVGGSDPNHADEDYDGMEDRWETAHGLDPADWYDAYDDPDGDGIQNQFEYVLGFHPTIANSAELTADRDNDGMPDYWEAQTGSFQWSHATQQYEFQRLLDWDNPADAMQDPDTDSLTNLAEYILGADLWLQQTFTGIPDAWLASYYTTVTGFNPQADDDNEELTNFEEYLYSTNPLNPDTDGDGISDFAEVNQGSNPNGGSNGGSPPPDPVIDVSFLVGGDYASWRMEILPKGPRDDRAALKLASPYPGATETKTLKLWKNNRYEITLHRTGGYEDWYCWEAMVDDGPNTFTFDDGWGWITDGVRNDQGHFFTVAGHWLADNRQGLLSAHQHSYAMDIASPLKAELVPVAIEDNIEATGVDIVSNSVNPDVAGYQDKLWIMAPSGNDPNGNACSNAMKFKIPFGSSKELEISYPQGSQAPATPTPGTVTLGATSADCSWHGVSTTTTETPAVEWKIGEPSLAKTEVKLPIAVKTMKRRTVKVAVYPVKAKNGDIDDLRPSKNELTMALNRVFAYQVNAWFDVDIKPPQTDDYDEDNNRELMRGTLDHAQLLNRFKDPAADITIILVSQVNYLAPTSSGKIQEVYGSAETDSFQSIVNTAFMVDEIANGMPIKVAYAIPVPTILATVVHEIGHLFVGEGHPDKDGAGEDPGVAPLKGTDRTKRLMHSEGESGSSGELLVKTEWDKAEESLSSRPNGDN